MLKYNIKLTDDSIKQEKLVWSEKYLAPDLSFVTGVTSQDYHLEKFKRLPLTNSLVDNFNASALLDTENVSRQGYVLISGKTYDANSGSVTDYSIESSGTPIDYKYLFLNGKYYYSHFVYYFENTEYHKKEMAVVAAKAKNPQREGETDEAYNARIEGLISSKRLFEIDHWLQVDNNTHIPNDESGITFSATSEIKIDTVAWIEDGIVNIDGHDYFFDREIQTDRNHKGGLKYYEDGECLDISAITKCDDIEFHPFETTSDYINVTKFMLTKDEEINEPFDSVSFCKRFYYVKHKENYLPIRIKTKSGDTAGNIDYYFICDIPNYLLKEKPEPYYETNEFQVYYMGEEYLPTSGAVSGSVSSALTDSITFDILKDTDSYITIENDVFMVDYDIMNSNDSNEIAVYLEGDASNIALGDRIKFVDASETAHTQQVYTVDNYDFNENSDTNFIIFNSGKYKVEPNICDKVMINGHEYTLSYNNGKIKDKDCLVLIGDEKVPMKISGTTNGAYSAGTLTRYGKIISGNTTSAITANYDIKPYSGITVDNKKYIILDEEISATTNNVTTVSHNYYATLDRNNEYTFLVEDIIGSSMLVCIPDINATDFTDDFTQFISKQICKDVVDNKVNMVLYSKNKIFGDKEITEELAFQANTNPISSDAYFNLFDNLELFSKSGYIHIPLLLSNSQGDNMLQDDAVENQYFEDVKKRSINPIVDMEKDVYYPKYIANNKGKYSGSETEFKPIKEIKVNLHFRTRNLDSWKVNEGYNDVSVSGNSDNWFITDFHPYKDILSDNTKLIDKETLEPCTNAERASEILMNTSDLVGLLNFTNDDVYYQKSKIAKSFLRFSFYDSIDEQKQSLLATSCVFMDEHKLFKSFIDNSRKNINDFGYISEPIMEQVQGGTTFRDAASGSVTNKVSVMTEYLGKRIDNGDTYLQPTNPYTSFGGTIIDDNHRLGSEFIIENKYETDTSSEGFYIYIFREYSENLMPKPIYMKVEFNHAGIGHTIPFILPMKWKKMKINGVDSRNGKMVPDAPYTLSSTTEVENLKKGVKLEDIYAQSYIPLYAVYDFKNKEYAYVFDSRYVKEDDDDVINLNLFELKIANDDDTSDDAKKAKNIKNQATAVIDINTEQFNRDEKICDE